MFKRSAFAILSVLVLVGAIVFIYVGMIKALIASGANQQMPVTPVTAATIKAESWQQSLTSVGTLSAVQGVTVSAQLDGTVTGIHFESGAKVQQGDLLVELDVGPEKAQLQAAQATLELAKTTLHRSQQLRESNTIAQAQLDQDLATEKADEAQVANISATIAKKTIRAPFTGRLGVRLINLGQTLKAGDAIVSLQSLDPIYADFYIPQQELARTSTGLAVSVGCDAYPGQTFGGKLTAINPEIDATTRNVRLQATLANAKEELRPGMFVSVNVVLPKSDQVLAIPQTAVLYAPYGDSVFVIVDQKDPASGKEMKVLRQQFVRLGRKQGDFVAVDEGLKAGDTIVTSGAFKLRPTMPVSIDNSLAPNAQLNPKPSDT